MIVRRFEGEALCFTQADHARLAAEFLSLFRLTPLLEHPRRPQLLRAVREHDNGWWEEDSAPRRAADGRSARDFREASAAMRREIWRRGYARFGGEAPYLAALVARHAARLASSQAVDEDWEIFRGELELAVEGWRLAAGVSDEELRADASWVALSDGLSLVACTGDPSLFRCDGWAVSCRERGVDDEVTVGVAPFPLAGSTRFELPYRRLPLSDFASDASLSVAMATSNWRRLAVRLVPLAAL